VQRGVERAEGGREWPRWRMTDLRERLLARRGPQAVVASGKLPQISRTHDPSIIPNGVTSSGYLMAQKRLTTNNYKEMRHII